MFCLIRILILLLEHSFVELNILLSYLKNNPSVKIHIEGHTDNVGGREHNLKFI